MKAVSGRIAGHLRGCRTKRIFCIWLFNEKDFASSDATKGLSGRPLETFGCHPYEYLYSYAANSTAPF